VVGLVAECGPGGEAQVGVRPFNGAIGANPDPVIGRSVETGGTMRSPAPNWSSRLRYSAARSPVSMVFVLGSTTEMGGDMAKIGDRGEGRT
jgi:hypothetical protein